MKFIFSFLVCVAFTSAFAQESECLKRVGQELKTESEMYLYNKHPKVAEIFELKCSDSNYGNTLYSSDAFVFIHEAAHFEDLKWDVNNMGGVDQANPAKDFNLFTVNNEHIGNFSSFKNLPKIKDVIRPYLEKEKPKFLEEDSIFMGMHDGYIGAEDSMAAEIIQGMATELNGYTHGTVVQFRVLPKLPNPVIISDDNGGQHTMENPYIKLPSQTDGVMYFLYNFNLYLRLLKKDYPEVWNEFYPSNKEYLNRLFTPSIEVLKKHNHCELAKSYEPIRFYVDELSGDDLSILEDILGKDKVQNLACTSDKLKVGLSVIDRDQKSLKSCVE